MISIRQSVNKKLNLNDTPQQRKMKWCDCTICNKDDL